jgi:hypothetical protein
MRLLRQLVATIGTFGALIALVVRVTPHGASLSDGQIALLVTAIVAFGLQIIFDVVDFRRGRAKQFRAGPRQTRRIRDFMFAWINSGGRVAVFSNDLSWVDDDEMRGLLRRKANGGELILVTPRETVLTRELAAAGAETIHYAHVDYVIRSRFTISQFERSASAVAIGSRTPNGDHRIERFSTGTDPAFSLALDLVEILRRLTREVST